MPLRLFERFPSRLLLAFFGLLMLGAVPQVQGQTANPREPLVQVGFGMLPRIGWQIGYISPRSFFIREGMLNVHVAPGIWGERPRIQFTGGFGASVRTLNIARVIANIPNVNNDLDIGLRVGPSLTFARRETRADKNQRFNLSIEPFLRLTTRLRSQSILYTEVGLQKPSLRVGLWINL